LSHVKKNSKKIDIISL